MGKHVNRKRFRARSGHRLEMNASAELKRTHATAEMIFVHLLAAVEIRRNTLSTIRRYPRIELIISMLSNCRRGI